MVAQLNKTRKTDERIILQVDSLVQMSNSGTLGKGWYSLRKLHRLPKKFRVRFVFNIQSSLFNIPSYPLLQPLPLKSP